ACRERSEAGRYLVHSDIGMTAGTGARPTLPSVATVGRIMDLAYKAYGKIFELPRDDQLVHRVYVFAHREDFLAFTKSLGYDDSLPSTYLGGFDPQTRILAVDGTPDASDANRLDVSDQTLRVLLHEGFHQFNDSDVPDMPIWFDEGIAEYFAPTQ